MTLTRLPRPFPPATSLEATSAPKHHHLWGSLNWPETLELGTFQREQALGGPGGGAEQGKGAGLNRARGGRGGATIKGRGGAG